MGLILVLVCSVRVLEGFVKLVEGFLYDVLIERVGVICNLVELFYGVIVGVVVVMVDNKGRVFI